MLFCPPACYIYTLLRFLGSVVILGYAACRGIKMGRWTFLFSSISLYLFKPMEDSQGNRDLTNGYILCLFSGGTKSLLSFLLV